jgi:hypothetical protein
MEANAMHARTRPSLYEQLGTFRSYIPRENSDDFAFRQALKFRG